MDITREELKSIISEAITEAARLMNLDNGIRDSSCAPSIMSVRDISEALHVSMPTAYGLVRNGDIPSVKVGRKYVVDRDVFLGWLDHRKESAQWHKGE